MFNFKCEYLVCIHDWKCDQYRWFQNAIKDIPANDPVIKKRYYFNVTPDGKSSEFVRHSYTPLNKKENYVLIHCIKDHARAVQFPHGNCKTKQQKPFIRTCPSVLRAAKNTVESPANVYKKLISKSCHSSGLQPVLVLEM